MLDNNRFTRQERLPQVGLDGQKLIQEATVAIIGIGALGCSSAEWLCRAGVAKIILIDRDIVNLSNLQRQCLFNEDDAAARTPKAIAAAARLRTINSACVIETHCVDLGAHNIDDICREANVLVDGCDNFFTRYLLNDYSVKHRIDYVYAGAVGTYGMVALLQSSKACLRCVFPEPPAIDQTPTCASAGVLGPAIGVVASLASTLAIQSICKADYHNSLSISSYGLSQPKAFMRKQMTNANVAPKIITSGSADSGQPPRLPQTVTTPKCILLAQATLTY